MEDRIIEQRQKTGEALAVLRKLQEDNRMVFQSQEFTKYQLGVLQGMGFLEPITKRGWWRSSNPQIHPQDPTLWYAGFWQFCSSYCQDRFGDDWHLSAEQSLNFHVENTIIPNQIIVFSQQGNNNRMELPFKTSMFDSRETNPIPQDEIEVKNCLRIFTLAGALVRLPNGFYRKNSLDAEIALGGLKDIRGLIDILLREDRSIVAGRLTGAFRHIGRHDIAEQIANTFKKYEYSNFRENNPFESLKQEGPLRGYVSPIVGRIRKLWESKREYIVSVFPESTGEPNRNDENDQESLSRVFQEDAYHSLRIEGYRVTPEMIKSVVDWNPENYPSKEQQHDARACRGYFLAFKRAESIIQDIIKNKKNPGDTMRQAHFDFYQDLFTPDRESQSLKKESPKYRGHFIYLRGSRYVPPQHSVLPEAMGEFLDLLSKEPHAGVRAVLGHWLLGYIHPFHDGNGRTARLLMNTMLASGGYPWTVIRVDDRDQYMKCLDSASIDGDIKPFAQFIADRVKWSMDKLEEKDEESILLPTKKI